LFEIKGLLIAPGLCHFHGMMERWNAGILGIKAEVKHYNCKKLLSFNFVQDKLTHYSIIPLFQVGRSP